MHKANKEANERLLGEVAPIDIHAQNTNDINNSDNIFQSEKKYLHEITQVLKSRYENLKDAVDKLENYYKETLAEIAQIGKPDDRILAMKELNRLMKERGYKFKKNEVSTLSSSVNVPYFARLDFRITGNLQDHNFYVGKHAVFDKNKKMLVIDWRAPLASLYYNYSEPTKNAKYVFERENTYQPWIKEKRTITGDLNLRRNFDIENSQLLSVYDNSLKIDLLTNALNKKKGGLLEDIVATIQDVQDKIIREDPESICIVQGTAGSGKTTIAIHRISYLFYSTRFSSTVKDTRATNSTINHESRINAGNTLLLTTSKVLVNYIAKTLPELEVFDITQDTLAGLLRKYLKKSEILIEGKTHDKKPEYSYKLNNLEFIDHLNDYIDAYTDDVKKQIFTHKYYKELDIERLAKRIENKPVFEFIRNILEYLDDYNSDVKRLVKDGRYTLEYLSVFITEFVKFLNKIINEFNYVKFVSEIYKENGIITNLKTNVYLDDICLIFYLYVKLNGFVNEAGKFQQIIVDEGQDLGILNYLVIKSISDDKGVTIMGDLNQSSTTNGTITDWTDLETIFNKGNIKYFNIEYSYRTTRQIATFAGNILAKFPEFKYLPKPFDRDGEEVKFTKFESRDELLNTLVKKVIEIRNSGDKKSIGIIEPDLNLLTDSYDFLKNKIDNLILVDENFENFENDKIYLIPESIVKGLEFSTVFLLDPNDKLFPKTKESAKKLFVCSTRAINRLEIYYIKNISSLVKYI